MIHLRDRAQARAALGQLRREQQLSQTKLGERIHVSYKTVCYRETGRVGIELGDLIATAEALGYDVVLVPHTGRRRAAA